MLTHAARTNDVNERLSFASTSAVIAQVQAGAPTDVVGVADRRILESLIAQGSVLASPVAVVRNELVIAVEPGNPINIRGLSDLANGSIVVVVADPSVPAGDYAEQVLRAANVSIAPASREANVRVALSRVALGEADAAIVYATDVESSRENVEAVAFDNGDLVIEAAVGVATATDHRAAAISFVEALAEVGAVAGFEPFRLAS